MYRAMTRLMILGLLVSLLAFGCGGGEGEAESDAADQAGAAKGPGAAGPIVEGDPVEVAEADPVEEAEAVEDPEVGAAAAPEIASTDDSRGGWLFVCVRAATRILRAPEALSPTSSDAPANCTCTGAARAYSPTHGHAALP